MKLIITLLIILLVGLGIWLFNREPEPVENAAKNIESVEAAS